MPKCYSGDVWANPKSFSLWLNHCKIVTRAKNGRAKTSDDKRNQNRKGYGFSIASEMLLDTTMKSMLLQRPEATLRVPSVEEAIATP